MNMSYRALLLGAFAVGGCNGGVERAEQVRDSAGMMDHMDSGGMGMSGMRMESMQMMPQMRAHLDSMMRMSPEQMQGMMARHQSMMSQMMDRTGAEMRGMQMRDSSAWNALTDSVKRDLAELPDLKGSELFRRMRAHSDRVKRLLAMHEQMMAR